MTRKYFAYNWLIDFDAVDFNCLLDFIDENGLELRRPNVGNKFLRFALAVDDELQLRQFVSMIDKNVSNTEWHSIPYTEFQKAIPVEHTHKHRAETLTTLDLMRKYTYETSKFYQEIYKSEGSNRLYRTQWTINKKGLDERVIEKAFDVVEDRNDVRIAMNRPGLASHIDIYMVMRDSRKLDELMTDIPKQIAESVWVEISPDNVPDEISGHPYKYDANIYPAWREGLYDWLLQSNN